MSSYQTIQIMIAFGMFIVSLISLVVRIAKDGRIRKK